MLSTNMPQSPILNSDSFPEANPRTLEIIADQLLPRLVRGMRSETSSKLGAFVLKETRNMQALLFILENPEAFEKIQIQKAAWVLHRSFQEDQRGLLSHRASLARALEATDDTSVLREILKVLANPMWLDLESESIRSELMQLALDLLHLTNIPIGVHYAALQIIQIRITSNGEASNAIAAIEELMNGQPEPNPLYRCAEKHKSRLMRRVDR